MITYSKNTASSVQTNDEEGSLKSSRKSCRKLERSTSRHSSRSHSKEHESSALSNFYVKNLWNKQIQNPNGNTTPLKQQKTQIKRRQPTPCKSKKQLGSFVDNSYKNKQSQRLQIIQKNVAINELENNLAEKQSQIEKLYKKIKRMQEQIYNIQKQLYDKQQRNAKLTFSNKQLQIKIGQLEQTVLQSQQSIAMTNNALERLKKSIQENRLNDLKLQNEAQRAKINQLLSQSQKNIKDLKVKTQKVYELEKENKVLRGKIQLQLSLKSESMKQAYLLNEISRLKSLQKQNSLQPELHQCCKKHEQQQARLKSEVNKMAIQLDYIHRKHMEEIRLITKTKAQQMAKYRKKCKQLHMELLKREKIEEEKSNGRKGNKIGVGFGLIKTGVEMNRIDESWEEKKDQLLGLGSQKSYRNLSMSFQLSSDND